MNGDTNADDGEQLRRDARTLYKYISAMQTIRDLTHREVLARAGVPQERATRALAWLREIGVLSESYRDGVAYVNVCQINDEMMRK